MAKPVFRGKSIGTQVSEEGYARLEALAGGRAMSACVRSSRANWTSGRPRLAALEHHERHCLLCRHPLRRQIESAPATKTCRQRAATVTARRRQAYLVWCKHSKLARCGGFLSRGAEEAVMEAGSGASSCDRKGRGEPQEAKQAAGTAALRSEREACTGMSACATKTREQPTATATLA